MPPTSQSYETRYRREQRRNDQPRAGPSRWMHHPDECRNRRAGRQPNQQRPGRCLQRLFHCHDKVRIAAWNAQTLNDPIDENPEMKGFPSPDNCPAKALELTRELECYRVAIAGISETHWPGQGEKRINGFQFLYSGRNDNVRRDGVALVLSQEASRELKYH